jgi:hypothetical protein
MKRSFDHSGCIIACMLLVAITTPTTSGISPQHRLQRDTKSTAPQFRFNAPVGRRLAEDEKIATCIRLRGGGLQKQSSSQSLDPNAGIWHAISKIDPKVRVQALESLRSLFAQLTSIGRASQHEFQSIAKQIHDEHATRAYLQSYGIVFNDGELVVGDEELIERADKELEDRLAAAQREASSATAASKRTASEALPKSQVA